MNIALGAETAGGAGVPALEVTQRGAGPEALVATQPAGNAGATTPSKFWLEATTVVPNVNVQVLEPKLVAPSCQFIVTVIVPPHVPEVFEKLKLRQTAGPPNVTTP